MITTETGICTCDICSQSMQIYATSVWSDRTNDIVIGDTIYCPNCNSMYVFLGDTTGENVFYRPNRFITKSV